MERGRVAAALKSGRVPEATLAPEAALVGRSELGEFKSGLETKEKWTWRAAGVVLEHGRGSAGTEPRQLRCAARRPWREDEEGEWRW